MRSAWCIYSLKKFYQCSHFHMPVSKHNRKKAARQHLKVRKDNIAEVLSFLPQTVHNDRNSNALQTCLLCTPSRSHPQEIIEILAGRDKGKQGIIKSVNRKHSNVLVEGLKLIKKLAKSNKNNKGGAFTKEAPIHYSNLAHVDPKSGSSSSIIPKPTLELAKKWRKDNIDGALDTSATVVKEKTYDEASKTGATQNVRVAIQLEDGKRMQATVKTSLTLWDILLHFESTEPNLNLVATPAPAPAPAPVVVTPTPVPTPVVSAPTPVIAAPILVPTPVVVAPTPTPVIEPVVETPVAQPEPIPTPTTAAVVQEDKMEVQEDKMETQPIVKDTTEVAMESTTPPLDPIVEPPQTGTTGDPSAPGFYEKASSLLKQFTSQSYEEFVDSQPKRKPEQPKPQPAKKVTIQTPQPTEPEEPSDRNLSVYIPNEEEMDVNAIEFDESFTSEDFKRLVEANKRIKREKEEMNSMLRTKGMREREMEKKARKFLHTTVRLYFPDRRVLEMTFLTAEKIARLESYLISKFEEPLPSFYLYVTPPRKELNGISTFSKEGLYPGVKVFLGLRGM
eukprot:gene5753-6660_t